jgi:hypothetical protein
MINEWRKIQRGEKTGMVIILNKVLVSSSKNSGYPGPVAHSCNPSYSRGRNWEDGSSRPALQGNLSKTPILTNRPRVVVHVFNFSYLKAVGRRITVQGWPRQNTRPYPKSN